MFIFIIKGIGCGAIFGAFMGGAVGLVLWFVQYIQ